MKYILITALVALVSAAPANEKRQLDELTALLGGGAAAAPAAGEQNNAAAADPLTSLLGGGAGGADPLAGLIKKRQLEDITSLLTAGDAAAPAAGAPAAGQKAADGDLLADFTKAGLPIPRRRSRRQLEQITALLGKGKGNAKAAKGKDPLAALTGALGGAKAAKGNAKGQDPLAALGAIARKRALVKRRVALAARDIEDDEDDAQMQKRQTFVSGQGQQQQQGQGQQTPAAGPTADVGTILGVLSLGGPSGTLTQNSGVGPILANDPTLAGGNANGLQPQINGNPGINGQTGQNGQQGGAGVTLALTDPNVNQIGQPSLISSGPLDLGGFQGSGIVL